MLAFIDPETLIPADQRLPAIKSFANAALAEPSPLFDRVHAGNGQRRHSNPHELRLKADLPMYLYSVR
jgi:hypothetical protein